jgi:hypothetical protein
MGRVAKYKKVKKFDLHDQKIDDAVNKPSKRKEANSLPHSFRAMKYQKELMLRAEARRLERKKQAKAQEVAKNAPRLDHDPVDVEGVKYAPAEPENEKISREAERSAN